VFFADGSAKPAFTAWRFPFVVDARSRDAAVAWGKSPAAGRLAIQRRDGGRWKSVENLNATVGQVFTERLRARSGQRFRAMVAGEKSLVWRLQ
jgi:hypothetical protein